MTGQHPTPALSPEQRALLDLYEHCDKEGRILVDLVAFCMRQMRPRRASKNAPLRRANGSVTDLDMHPEEIKAAIRMKGTTPAVIADDLGVSRSMVTQVIKGSAKSARIAQRIAEVVGRPAEAIWPQQRPVLRRARTAAARQGVAA
jgi:lambda repressor-like predicted transcriptional regulator